MKLTFCAPLFLLLLATTALASELDQRLAAAQLLETAALVHPAPADTSKFAQVSAAYQKLVAEYPSESRAHAARAEWLWSINEKANSLSEWQAAEKLDPRSARVADALGECALAQGDWNAASAWFQKSVSLEPANSAFHFDLANVWFLGRHQIGRSTGAGDGEKSALAEFKQATTLAPFNIEYARAYAETFYGMENPDWREALQAWNHYREIANSDNFACVNIARIDIKLDLPGDARRVLGNVRGKDFDPVKAHLLTEIKALEH